jgi:hypothetical protein
MEYGSISRRSHLTICAGGHRRVPLYILNTREAVVKETRVKVRVVNIAIDAWRTCNFLDTEFLYIPVLESQLRIDLAMYT